jgi:transcriptional regulator with XRE-family HTH domain
MTMKASEWLNQQFLKWEQGRGRRATVTEFARHLGVTQQSLSSYMSGAYLPRGANLGKIAARLGPEIYDLVGAPRSVAVDDPAMEELKKIIQGDPAVLKLVKKAGKLPGEIRSAVIELVDQASNLCQNEDPRVRQSVEGAIRALAWRLGDRLK